MTRSVSSLFPSNSSFLSNLFFMWLLMKVLDQHQHVTKLLVNKIGRIATQKKKRGAKYWRKKKEWWLIDEPKKKGKGVEKKMMTQKLLLCEWKFQICTLESYTRMKWLDGTWTRQPLGCPTFPLFAISLGLERTCWHFPHFPGRDRYR